MKVIGLTGGIASGKSAVSKILKDLGAYIISADVVAREIVQPGEKAWLEIVFAFGRDILRDDGDINRKKLGRLVFSDPEKLARLNQLTHPEIIQRIKNKIEQMKDTRANPVVVVEAPLLFETGMEKVMDEVWVVALPEKLQVKRLIQREDITPNEAQERINAQMPLEEKISRANRVIDNSGDIDSTRQHVVGLWEEIMADNQE